MSSETLSTTLRRLNHFDSPCATSPSISVVALRLLLGDLDGCLVLLLRVEDRLHPLLLAALHDAPVLIDEDRDLLAGDDVVLPPDARVADQLDALLAVVVLGPPGGPGPAVPRDDPDVAGRDGADHPFAPLVEVDLHPVGVLEDRKSTRLNSSHRCISYAVFCLKKKKITHEYSQNKATVTQYGKT